MSGCLKGIIPQVLLEGNLQQARYAIKKFISIFGENDFYIEIQRHNLHDEDRVRPHLIQLAEEFNVKVYRPGPMDYIPEYLEGVKDAAKVHYDCPEGEPIRSPTYGVMVYQEQLMQIARELSGYSLGEADILRKACGKKKKT